MENYMLDIIKLSLWNMGSAMADEQIYEEIKKHAIVSLPTNVLSSISMTPELYKTWQKETIRQLAHYYKYIYIQSTLPISVPYVILKGTAAAQYYPYPKFRTMGDIDVITRRDDYEYACQQLIENNYHEITSISDVERGRHRAFEKNKICVEVHSFFASMNDPNKAKYFDDLIINNINESHILPDLINGLVIIEHINQHMEEGIGIRQVIDWMMFVDKCLSDYTWPEFKTYAHNSGLETLAIVVTRMCEMYLGLSEHEWSKSASEELCTGLLEYVLASGNFGKKIDKKQNVAIKRAAELKHPLRMKKKLQAKGAGNWSAAKNPMIKPMAWIWQGFQILKSTPGLIKGYYEANRQEKLFDALEVKRVKNGLVYFKNGEYYKKDM